MNIKEIRLLSEILNKSGLTAMEISQDDIKIRLEKNVPVQVSSNINIPITEQASFVKPMEQIQALDKMEETVVDFNKVCEVKSPMVGVFYSSPAVGNPPFVEVGTKVKKGDVLCIIEAMKLMNEIVAEYDGEIVDICVEDGQLVEFSQILFKLF